VPYVHGPMVAHQDSRVLYYETAIEKKSLLILSIIYPYYYSFKCVIK